MTTLEKTKCKEHTPNVSACEDVRNSQFTFCEICENNIERFWIEDPDRLSWWSDWSISK
jgi:hypothetical protein